MVATKQQMTLPSDTAVNNNNANSNALPQLANAFDYPNFPPFTNKLPMMTMTTDTPLMVTLANVITVIPTTIRLHVDLHIENSAQFPATTTAADNNNMNSNVLPSLANASYLIPLPSLTHTPPIVTLADCDNCSTNNNRTACQLLYGEFSPGSCQQQH